MKAGRMRSVIEVFRPETERNAYGESTRTWASQGRWHAERVSLIGRRVEEVAEHFADMTVRYNIRIQHRVETGWQLTDETGIRYEIVAVEPVKWLGMQELRCERLNP